MGVLCVEFLRIADIDADFEQLDHNSNHYTCAKVLDLSQEAPVMIFENAAVTRNPSLNTTGRLFRGKRGTVDDIFHHDAVYNKDGTAVLSMTTVLSYTGFENRDQPTWFADIYAVREAMKKLPYGTMAPEVRQAVELISSSSFRSSEITNERGTIRRNYPKFMTDLLPLIPDSKKLAHQWRGNTHQVTMHNNAGDVLHGRKAGTEHKAATLHGIGLIRK
ncbi:MAG: hypothetical protein GC137_02365 [Alphaproteobacteria bacterium]|nr:hypothetical protein [Alphaproteobacteria bacterium]